MGAKLRGVSPRWQAAKVKSASRGRGVVGQTLRMPSPAVAPCAWGAYGADEGAR